MQHLCAELLLLGKQLLPLLLGLGRCLPQLAAFVQVGQAACNIGPLSLLPVQHPLQVYGLHAHRLTFSSDCSAYFKVQAAHHKESHTTLGDPVLTVRLQASGSHFKCSSVLDACFHCCDYAVKFAEPTDRDPRLAKGALRNQM